MNEIILELKADIAALNALVAIAEAKEAKAKRENEALRQRLAEAQQVMEVLDDMHNMYRRAIKDYDIIAPDEKAIYGFLKHGHIRAAAAWLAGQEERP